MRWDNLNIMYIIYVYIGYPKNCRKIRKPFKCISVPIVLVFFTMSVEPDNDSALKRTRGKSFILARLIGGYNIKIVFIFFEKCWNYTI